MRVIWQEDEVTAKKITEILSAQKPIAHSTVQTLLRKLEEKGAIVHEQKERTFVYRAAVAESAVTRSAAQEFLDRVFSGSVSGLVAHLLENEEVDPEELALLRRMVDSKAQEEKR